MALTIKHKFTSNVADAADSTLVRPSNWNDSHIASGSATGDLIYADAGGGLNAISDVAVGSVFVSKGVGVAPAWSIAPIVSQMYIGVGAVAPDTYLTISANVNIPALQTLPSAILHFIGPDSTQSTPWQFDTYGGAMSMIFRRANFVTDSSPANLRPLVFGNSIMNFTARGYDGVAYSVAGSGTAWEVRATESWSTLGHGAQHIWRINYNGQTITTEVMYLGKGLSVSTNNNQDPGAGLINSDNGYLIGMVPLTLATLPGTSAFSWDNTNLTLNLSRNANTTPAGTASTPTLRVQGIDGIANTVNLDSYGSQNSFVYRRANGTNPGSLTGLIAGDIIGNLAFRGYDSSLAYSLSNSATIIGIAGETWTNATHGAYLTFGTTPSGSTATATVRMVIGMDGGVNIGSSITAVGAGVLNVAANTASVSTVTGAIITPGGLGVGGAIFCGSTIYSGSTAFILGSKTAITGGTGVNTAAFGAGNAPVNGNPTKWLPYDDNGATRYIPSW